MTRPSLTPAQRRVLARLASPRPTHVFVYPGRAPRPVHKWLESHGYFLVNQRLWDGLLARKWVRANGARPITRAGRTALKQV